MKPKFFIIEGPDRTGKSTLAKFLHDYLYMRGNVVGWHMDFNKELAKTMQAFQTSVVNNLIDNHLKLKSSVVLDRCWPSNIIYRKVIDNQPACDWGEMQEKLRTIGAIYIFADCESCLARHASDKDPDHPYEDEKFNKIVESYRELYKELSVMDNCVRYDMDVYGDRMDTFMGILGI